MMLDALQQVCERLNDLSTVGDKTSVEVHKSEKLPEFPDGCQSCGISF